MAYPASLDELTDGVPSDGTAAATTLGDVTYPHDDHHRALGVAVEAIETELGTTAAGNYIKKTAAVDLGLAPTGAVGQTYGRNGPTYANQAAALVSGQLRMCAMWLPAGTTVTNIVWTSGTQAAVAPTNWWFGLYDSSRVCLRLTADQTSTAWAANTAKSVALSSAFLTTYTGLHYVSCMVAAGTVPSLVVTASAVGTVLGLAPILTGQSDTGLTTPPSLPFTAAAITASGGYPYVYAT